MRRADKQVGWGPDGWKAAALAAFIVPGASAAWSWAAPIGLELSRRSAFQALQVGPGCSPPRRTSQVFGFKVTNGRQAADTVGSGLYGAGRQAGCVVGGQGNFVRTQAAHPFIKHRGH